MFDDLKKLLKGAKAYLSEVCYSPRDIVFAAYTVPTINGVSIGAFRCFPVEYWETKTKLVTGKEFLSLGGSRKAVMSNRNEPIPSFDNGDINAVIKQFITLEEVCLAWNLDLYLKKYVTDAEINKLLQCFRSGCYFQGMTDMTKEELMNIIQDNKPAVSSENNTRRLTIK